MVTTRAQFRALQYPVLIDFPLFPEFPGEVRNMIWATACYQTRIVDIWAMPLPKLPQSVELLPSGTLGTDGGSQYKSFTPIPAILHTSREARTEARKHYKLDFSKTFAIREANGRVIKARTSPTIYVNWISDIFCFANYHSAYAQQPEVTMALSRGLTHFGSKLRRVALCPDEARYQVLKKLLVPGHKIYEVIVYHEGQACTSVESFYGRKGGDRFLVCFGEWKEAQMKIREALEGRIRFMKAEINMYNAMEKAQREKIVGFGVPFFKKEVMLPDFQVKILKEEKALKTPKKIRKGSKKRSTKAASKKGGAEKSDIA